MSEIRTLVILLLKKKKTANYKAQIEEFGDDLDSLLTWLRKINFL
jgi:hypothetical protein